MHPSATLPQDQGLGEATAPSTDRDTPSSFPLALFPLLGWGKSSHANRLFIVPACWTACPFWQASLTLQIEAFVKGRHVAEYNSSLAHILNGYSRIKHHASFQGWTWFLPESSFFWEGMALGLFLLFWGLFLKEYHVHYRNPLTYIEALCVTTYARWLINFIILHWRTMVSYT